MSSTTFILLGTAYYLFTIILIVVVLSWIGRHEKKKYKDEIIRLERDKNLIISASILSELNRAESLVNNDVMQDTYRDWQRRFRSIKDDEVPKITDKLIEIDSLFEAKDFKKLNEKIAEVELQIFYVKTKANFLLEEIKEITLSEEKNRETITKLKTTYREIVHKYSNNKSDYEIISDPIELQFENVDKLFSTFEMAMDQNAYNEVGKIVRAIDDTIGNLSIVIDEAPSIILMGKGLIPKKIDDVTSIARKMIKEGYNLDYLNIEYNKVEAEKTIKDAFGRLNMLNLEDSILELKTILDYFDSIYNEFDKEKIAKKIYEEYARTIIVKATKLEKINNDLYKQLNVIKFSYDLTDEDVKIIDEIHEEIKVIKTDYDTVVNSARGKSFAYSRLGKEMELLNVRLAKSEDKLEIALRSLGSLKDDELRAREQLDEIKDILRKSKEKLASYKLPIIPKDYYVQLSEASEAIKEIIRELDKKPISIKVLNTRVDTARDLTLKLLSTTNETVKTANMAELAIVYGNRYRPINKDIDLGLTKAEGLFYKGNFKIALENAITAINLVEPGIHKKLLGGYKK